MLNQKIVAQVDWIESHGADEVEAILSADGMPALIFHHSNQSVGSRRWLDSEGYRLMQAFQTESALGPMLGFLRKRGIEAIPIKLKPFFQVPNLRTDYQFDFLPGLDAEGYPQVRWQASHVEIHYHHKFLIDFEQAVLAMFLWHELAHVRMVFLAGAVLDESQQLLQDYRAWPTASQLHDIVLAIHHLYIRSLGVSPNEAPLVERDIAVSMSMRNNFLHQNRVMAGLENADPAEDLFWFIARSLEYAFVLKVLQNDTLFTKVQAWLRGYMAFVYKDRPRDLAFVLKNGHAYAQAIFDLCFDPATGQLRTQGVFTSAMREVFMEIALEYELKRIIQNTRR